MRRNDQREYRCDDSVLGGLWRAEEWGFDGGGETYELGESVVAEVGDPDVAARVDGEGEGFQHGGVGCPSSGG